MTDRNTATCRHCRRSFRHQAKQGKPEPECCGQIECRARNEWSEAGWRGKARMARARKAAGVELDELDREALRRTGGVS